MAFRNAAVKVGGLPTPQQVENLYDHGCGVRDEARGQGGEARLETGTGCWSQTPDRPPEVVPANPTLAAAGTDQKLKVLGVGLVTGAVDADHAPLLPTAAVAHRLGVSAVRVRQLAARPDFPCPVAEGRTRLYRPADIDRFAQTRERAAYRARNVTDGNEEWLRAGLRAMLESVNMAPTEASHVRRLLATCGRRYLRSKARLLLDLVLRYCDDVPAYQGSRVSVAIACAEEVLAE